MKKILVVANETVAGKPLIDAVRERAAGEPVEVHVICPQNQPRHGYVIYDSMVRDAAENRLKMTLALLREAGIEADGEVMDPDPYAAIMDALGERDYDEIVISTHPETRSGWLREGLVDRVRRAARRPVEHVVVDLDAERDDVKRTLVVANQTVASPELLDLLRRKAAEEPRRFIVICPQSANGNGEGGGSDDTTDRLAHTLKALEDAGLEAIGQVEHRDPYTAIQNALQFYAPDDIVISTFPETRSGWLRTDLIGRVETSTGKPVEHVVSEETG
jgi:Universal stress protein family